MADYDASVAERLDHFVEYWDYLRQNAYENPEQLNLLGLEAILRFISEEFEYNRLQNKKLRRILKDRLIVARELLTSGSLCDELESLTAQIVKQVETGDSLQLRANVADSLLLCNHGYYVQGVVAGLLSYASGALQWNSELCERLLAELFSAFLYREFTLDEIAEILKKTFFERSTTEPGYYATTFIDVPIEMDEYLEQSPPNLQAWGEAQRDYIDKLTLADRFAAIDRYYLRSRKSYRFIAQMQGITLDRVVEIGPVTLYPPGPLFIDGAIQWELFHQDENSPNDRVNAAVVMSARSPQYGQEAALDALQSAVDALNFYWPGRLPVRLLRNQVLVADLSKELRASSSHADEQSDSWYRGLSTDYSLYPSHPSFAHITRIVSRIVSDSKAENRLGTALSAYGRAAKSTTHQAILNCWIAIDALFTLGESPNILVGQSNEGTEALAEAFFPAAIALQAATGVGWRLYDDLISADRNRRRVDRNIFQNVSDELIITSGLRPMPFSKIDLDNLVSRLPSWEQALGPSFLRERVSSVNRFYNNNAEAKKILFEIYVRTKAEVAVFYQLRNRVVHHADQSSVISRVFVERARTFARSLLAYANGEDVGNLREAIALTINGWERLNSKLGEKRSIKILGFDALIRRSVRRNDGISDVSA